MEEERGRVQELLENLRIEAEVLVFWLASGKLSAYEIIVNGASPGQKAEDVVEECLRGQEWWDELQKIRGKRETTGTEDISGIGSIYTVGSNWPDASFQQGPRGERVERFLGLRRLLKKSKRKHTMSGLAKLGVSLGMRTHRLSDDMVRAGNLSASEHSDSDSEDSDSEGAASEAVSEADMDDYESDHHSPSPDRSKIKRRRSHGDTMRGPPPSKKSTGEREVTVPERTPRKSTFPTISDVVVSAPDHSSAQPEASAAHKKSHSIPNVTISSEASSSKPGSLKEPSHKSDTPKLAHPLSARAERPPLSRHASQPKFSSKPVPMTRVATEDGPGPSIMFTDTPSPPPRRTRLPSAYHTMLSSPGLASHAEDAASPPPPEPERRRGSTYAAQGVPLSFNDLPCRAQHLILNELMRSESAHTAVVFTTLPSPAEGTSLSEEASAGYLGDLEVLCRACPPVLLVHSNSMTVTMSL